MELPTFLCIWLCCQQRPVSNQLRRMFVPQPYLHFLLWNHTLGIEMKCRIFQWHTIFHLWTVMKPKDIIKVHTISKKNGKFLFLLPLYLIPIKTSHGRENRAFSIVLIMCENKFNNKKGEQRNNWPHCLCSVMSTVDTNSFCGTYIDPPISKKFAFDPTLLSAALSALPLLNKPECTRKTFF